MTVDDPAQQEFKDWQKCRLCLHRFAGPVRLALGWECWRAYRGLPVDDGCRHNALREIGTALVEDGQSAEAMPFLEADLQAQLRFFPNDTADIMSAQSSVANCMLVAGRADEALPIQRRLYALSVKRRGKEKEETLMNAVNLAQTLIVTGDYAEARAFCRDQLRLARKHLGLDHRLTLRFVQKRAEAVYLDDDATGDDLEEAVQMMHDAVARCRRVFGASYPLTVQSQTMLFKAETARLRAEYDASEENVVYCDGRCGGPSVGKKLPGNAILFTDGKQDFCEACAPNGGAGLQRTTARGRFAATVMARTLMKAGEGLESLAAVRKGLESLALPKA